MDGEGLQWTRCTWRVSLLTARSNIAETHRQIASNKRSTCTMTAVFLPATVWLWKSRRQNPPQLWSHTWAASRVLFCTGVRLKLEQDRDLLHTVLLLVLILISPFPLNIHVFNNFIIQQVIGCSICIRQSILRFLAPRGGDLSGKSTIFPSSCSAHQPRF